MKIILILMSMSTVFISTNGRANDIIDTNVPIGLYTELKIPEQTTFHSKPSAHSPKMDILSQSFLPGDLLIQNYRRPFQTIPLADIVFNNLKYLESINKIFSLPLAGFKDYIVIKNFAHGFEGYTSPMLRPTSKEDHTLFWYAILPKNSLVKYVATQIEWFQGGVGNHMQLRILLDNNILLLPESLVIKMNETDIEIEIEKEVEDRTSDQPGLDIGDTNDWQNTDRKPQLISGNLIYCLMALISKNGPQEFSFINGITGNLTTSLIVASYGHMMNDQLSRGSYIYELPLQTTAAENQKLFEYVLNQNKSLPNLNLYNTVFFNCISEIFNAIQNMLADSPQRKTFLTNFDADQFNPYLGPRYLSEKGLTDLKHQIVVNFEPQFKNFSLTSKTQFTPEGKKTNSEIQKILKIVGIDDIETFVRQFALATATQKWKASSINDYFKFVVTKVVNQKNLYHAVYLKRALENDPEWQKISKNDQAQILAIHSKCVSIIGEIIQNRISIESEDFYTNIMISIKNLTKNFNTDADANANTNANTGTDTDF